MKNPIPAARCAMRGAAWWLRWMIEALRRREGSLSFHAEQGGFYARQAETLAATLGCILTDHLGPAADALERGAQSEDLLPDSEDSGAEEIEAGEPR